MKIPCSRLERWLESISVAGVLLSAAWLIHYWPQLPALIPRHYGFLGEVDAWGGKGALVTLLIVNFVLYLFLTLIRVFAPSYAKPGASRRALALSMELLTWVKAWTAGTFACLAWATVEISLGRAAALTPILMPLLISLSLIVVLIYCVLIFKEAGKTKE